MEEALPYQAIAKLAQTCIAERTAWQSRIHAQAEQIIAADTFQQHPDSGPSRCHRGGRIVRGSTKHVEVILQDVMLERFVWLRES